jgi:acyl transferase domain-containing protein
MAVIRDALANGGVAPAEVGYVETHGTGTSLGDPIEVQALGAVFGEDRPCDQPLLIGGVKTNIGHLEAAAGIAGLIKVVLALQHAEIPPSLHVRRLNAFIPWDELSVKVATQLTPWRAEGRPRLAGVSSLDSVGQMLMLYCRQRPLETS